MRFRATVFAVPSPEGPKLIAVSPEDDIFIVDHDSAPADFQQIGEKAAAGSGMAPVAYIFELEHNK